MFERLCLDSLHDDSIGFSFLTMLSNILNKAPQRKASYATGTDHWVPLDPEEIAIMPQEIVDGYSKVHPHVGESKIRNCLHRPLIVYFGYIVKIYERIVVG